MTNQPLDLMAALDRAVETARSTWPEHTPPPAPAAMWALSDYNRLALVGLAQRPATWDGPTQRHHRDLFLRGWVTNFGPQVRITPAGRAATQEGEPDPVPSP